MLFVSLWKNVETKNSAENSYDNGSFYNSDAFLYKKSKNKIFQKLFVV